MTKHRYRKLLIRILIITTIIGGGFTLWIEGNDADKGQVSTQRLSDEVVLPGGMPIGIYLETEGVLVLGTENIENVEGIFCEPAAYLIKKGDYIVGFNRKTITSKKDLLEEVKKIQHEDVVLTVRRKEETIDIKIEPVKVSEQEYKLGIWVRDNVQGLGTMTYLTVNSEFGALGHGIHDVDTNELVEISSGQLYRTSIRSVQKGKTGTPGGLEGIIVYNNYNVLGTITKNTDVGIFGTVDRIEDLFEEQEAVAICEKEDIKPGKATIRCTVDGKIEEYDIEIVRTELYNRNVNKGIFLKVTDERLLEMTGGIVQGMSGSPILQDGKIVGAVTHVLVNDPTSGYGIFIEDMLKQ